MAGSVNSIAAYMDRVLQGTGPWGAVFPWFRGERDVNCSTLLPQVFRKKYDENNLLQSFRRRAHLLHLPIVPPTDAIDQWLFLARHVGLPTRLLDWTEGALIALYFALTSVEEYEHHRLQFKADEAPRARAIVWMLNPMRLNRLAVLAEAASRKIKAVGSEEARQNYYPVTWYDPPKEHQLRNIGFENIARCWEVPQVRGTLLPVAIEPTTIHPRMNAQHSYFTVHGTDEGRLDEVITRSLAAMSDAPYATSDLLVRLDVDIPPSEGIPQLRTLGIADSTIMPDADSLAKELSRFMFEE